MLFTDVEGLKAPIEESDTVLSLGRVSNHAPLGSAFLETLLLLLLRLSSSLPGAQDIKSQVFYRKPGNTSDTMNQIPKWQVKGLTCQAAGIMLL